VSSTIRDTHRYGYPSRQPAEVLAVLVDDGSAETVASVAVQEAVARHAPVRFIQVVPAQLDDEGRSIAEEAMFRDGLHALRGHPRTHSVFEVLRGHTPETIRSRSRNAELLVVGSDPQTSDRRSLADQCVKAAFCPVRTVST
jgi:nucleotide-binding universal stress UspA family protein